MQYDRRKAKEREKNWSRTALKNGKIKKFDSRAFQGKKHSYLFRKIIISSAGKLWKNQNFEAYRFLFYLFDTNKKGISIFSYEESVVISLNLITSRTLASAYEVRELHLGTYDINNRSLKPVHACKVTVRWIHITTHHIVSVSRLVAKFSLIVDTITL